MLQNIKKLLEGNALLLAIVITVAIAMTSLSIMPKMDLGFKIKSSDKYLHAIAYFILTLTWFFAFREKIKKTNIKIVLLIALAFYGIIIEVLQGGITNYRTSDVYDVFANIFGILLATLIFDKLINWFNTI